MEKRGESHPKRIIQNWCLYAEKLAERQRMKNRKKVLVSRITEQDKKVFHEAYKKLKTQRVETDCPKRWLLKKLALSRSTRYLKIRKKKCEADDSYVHCFIDYSKKTCPPKSCPMKSNIKNSGKIVNSQKPQIILPPLKTKPWKPPGPPKKPVKPIVIIPPFKTRPWVPCPVQAKPKIKPLIEYPPLKLRKTPPMKDQSLTPKKPIRVRLRNFYPSPVSTLGKTWNLFKFITPTMQILRGRTSQYSKKFNFRTNGKQSAFIAVVALVNSHLCPMKLWRPSDLDEIISYGDINYRKQINNPLLHAVIKPPEVKFKVYTSRAKIYTEIGARTLKGVFDPQNTKDLITECEQVIVEFNCLIFTYCGQSYAIWKDHNDYYIFNSEDADETGRIVEKTRGTCCVIRSPNGFNKIFEYLVSCLRVSKKCYEIYSLRVNEKVSMEQEIRRLKHAVKKSSSKMVTENILDEGETILNDGSVNLSPYSTYNVFTSPSNVRSIRSKNERTIEWTDENISMGISYAVAMLCINRSLDPEFYTRDIIDKVIVLGNDLLAECADICFDDFDLCNPRSCPDEINWNFKLNNAHTNVQMDIFQRNVLSVFNLENALDDFFKSYCIGVLTTTCFVIAIWKENNEFFIFYPSPIDDVGQVSPKESKTKIETTFFPGLVVFQSMQEFSDNIISNVDKTSYCKQFELRICNITMTDEWNEPKSCYSHIENVADEKLVYPAVAAAIDCGTDELEKDEDITKVATKSFEDLMKKIRMKRGCSAGFIDFAYGGILCGRLSKESKQLNQYTVEYHSGAICMMSIAMTSFRDLTCWCGDTIDNVVTSGNNLYIESSVANNSKKLDLSMLITSLNLFGCEIKMKVEPFRKFSTKDLQHKNLLISLCELLSSNLNGYLCRGLDYWAIFKRESAFFVFDPLGIKVYEKKCIRRRAALYKFKSIERMAEQLMKSMDDIGEEVDECEIGGVLCCPRNIFKEIAKCGVKKTPKNKAYKNKKSIKRKQFFNDNDPNDFSEIHRAKIEAVYEEENSKKMTTNLPNCDG